MSYDRLIDAENRITEMMEKGINLNLYHNDDRIKIEYGIEINSKSPLMMIWERTMCFS